MKPPIIKQFMIGLSLIIVTGANILPQLVYAQSPNTGSTAASQNSTTINLTQKIQNAKNNASQAIDKRVASLNELINKINGMKNLSSANKTVLTSQVQSYVTELTGLKTKIQSDTDTKTLKSDIQSVVNSYRVYALFIPQLHIISAATIISTIADKLTSFSSSVSAKLQQSTNPSVQPLLTDLQNNVSDAKTQSQNAINTVIGLTPSGYPGNKSSLQNARSLLKTAEQDLLKARKDLQQIKQSQQVNKNAKISPPHTFISPSGKQTTAGS